jgi:hypothetical protein
MADNSANGEYNFLIGLADRLRARAEAADAAGDQQTAIEMRAASEAVKATDHLVMAFCAIEAAQGEWAKLNSPAA